MPLVKHTSGEPAEEAGNRAEEGAGGTQKAQTWINKDTLIRIKPILAAVLAITAWMPQGHADVPPPQPPLGLVQQIDNGIKDHLQPQFPDMHQNYDQMVQTQAVCRAEGGTPSALDCNFPPPPVVVQPLEVSIHCCDKSVYYQLAVQNGWAQYWYAIDAIITRESGWQVGIVNQGSGACGLGQALPCSKLGAAYGNAQGEFTWTVNYMFSRYGNPANAWAFWQSHGWY